jgi:CheY-like chemotaxis protein
MIKNRVLLVEDNEDNFELVRFLIERVGFEVLAGHAGAGSPGTGPERAA